MFTTFWEEGGGVGISVKKKKLIRRQTRKHWSKDMEDPEGEVYAAEDHEVCSERPAPS